MKKCFMVLGSLFTGLLSGFFGGGGGMLCVPLLNMLGFEQKQSHATALVVILPLCIISSFIYVRNGYFDGNAVLCAVIGVTVGGVMGALLMNKLNGFTVGLIFSLIMIGAGIKLLV